MSKIVAIFSPFFFKKTREILQKKETKTRSAKHTYPVAARARGRPPPGGDQPLLLGVLVARPAGAGELLDRSTDHG